MARSKAFQRRRVAALCLILAACYVALEWSNGVIQSPFGSVAIFGHEADKANNYEQQVPEANISVPDVDLTNTLRCAVINGVGFHADVAAGLTWAFQEAGCNMTSYMIDGYRIKKVMLEWYTGDFRNVSTVHSELDEYNVVILVTLMHSSFNATFLSNLMARPSHPRVLVMVHRPSLDLKSRAFTKLVRDNAMVGVGRFPPSLQLITIAPHVSAYLKSLLDTWSAGLGANETVGVPWFAPLFPISLPTPTAAIPYRDICIQGTVSLKRRDYGEAFETMSHEQVLPKLHMLNESLLILGGGPDTKNLKPPTQLAHHMRLLSHGMDYQEFYDVLSRCRAVLTAFATDEYITDTGSSTIAAALNAAAPLLGDARILKAYSFLDDNSTLTFDPPENATWPDVIAEGARVAVAQKLVQKLPQDTSVSSVAAGRYRRRNINYVEAMSTAFNAEIAAYHNNVADLKLRVMQRNKQTALHFLRETAAGKLN